MDREKPYFGTVHRDIMSDYEEWEMAVSSLVTVAEASAFSGCLGLIGVFLAKYHT